VRELLSIKLALAYFRRRKLRAILNTLSVAVAIAALVALQGLNVTGEAGKSGEYLADPDYAGNAGFYPDRNLGRQRSGPDQWRCRGLYALDNGSEGFRAGGQIIVHQHCPAKPGQCTGGAKSLTGKLG